MYSLKYRRLASGSLIGIAAVSERFNNKRESSNPFMDLSHFHGKKTFKQFHFVLVLSDTSGAGGPIGVDKDEPG